MDKALEFAIEVLESLPALIKLGVDTTTLINWSNEKLNTMVKENREPNDQEWDEKNNMVEEMFGQRKDLSEG